MVVLTVNYNVSKSEVIGSPYFCVSRFHFL